MSLQGRNKKMFIFLSFCKNVLRKYPKKYTSHWFYHDKSTRNSNNINFEKITGKKWPKSMWTHVEVKAKWIHWKSSFSVGCRNDMEHMKMKLSYNINGLSADSETIYFFSLLNGIEPHITLSPFAATLTKIPNKWQLIGNASIISYVSKLIWSKFNGFNAKKTHIF